MIAVTIGIGEHYARLALHAARAVKKMTGLNTIILDDRHFTSSGLPYSHQLKLRIFDLVKDDAIMYFDSDMVCLNPWNPERFTRADALVAVAERLHPMIITACRDWDIPIHQYFNSGFMILNRECHQEWFKETERFVLANPGIPSYDPYDQTALNITRHRLGLKIELLDRRYNWVGFGASEFSYELPVFMAHCLNPSNKFANIDFFEGRYKPPFQWRFDVKEAEMVHLSNRTFCLTVGGKKKNFLLNSDGTVGPPYFPGLGRYWFVHERSGHLTLDITSETEILREFKKVSEDCWQSIQQLQIDIPRDTFPEEEMRSLT